MPLKLPRTLSSRALWAASIVWALVAAVYLVPFCTALLEQRGAFKDPTGQVRVLIGGISVLADADWFRWVAGGSIGLVTGFAGAAWLLGLKKGVAPTARAASVTIETGVYSADQANERAARSYERVLEDWNNVERLTLREAACLWHGIDPTTVGDFSLSGSSAAYLRILRQAVENGDLIAQPASENLRRGIGVLAGNIWVEDLATATRDAFRQLPIAQRERPAFLFSQYVSNTSANLPRGSFSLRFVDPDHLDHTCNLVITLARDCQTVVVIGRYAVLSHYLTDARWTWCLPERLAEKSNLMANEVVEVPYFARPSAKRGTGDQVTAVGKSVPLKTDDWDQGIMVRIQVVAHIDDERLTYDRVFQFRRCSGRHFTDAIDMFGENYEDDNRTL